MVIQPGQFAIAIGHKTRLTNRGWNRWVIWEDLYGDGSIYAEHGEHVMKQNSGITLPQTYRIL